MEKGINTIVIMLLLTVVLSALGSYFVMLLWNGCLVDAIDGVNRITWLQACGITILFSFLFKNTNISKK